MKVDWNAIANKDVSQVKLASAPLGWLVLSSLGSFLMLTSVFALNDANNSLLAGVNQSAMRVTDSMIDSSQMCAVAMILTIFTAIGCVLGVQKSGSGVSFRRWATLSGGLILCAVGALLFAGDGLQGLTTADRCMLATFLSVSPALGWLVGVLLPETPVRTVPLSPQTTSGPLS